jgi:hypothetical protein
MGAERAAAGKVVAELVPDLEAAVVERVAAVRAVAVTAAAARGRAA